MPYGARHATPNSIRRLRQERGLSTRALAGRAKVAQSQVSRWENGSQDMFLDNAVVLARALGVSVSDLLAPPPAMANSIRAIRLRRGFTEAELGHRLGVVQSMVSEWETGARRLTLVNAMAVARVLAVSVEDLAAMPSPASGTHPVTEADGQADAADDEVSARA